MFVEIKKLIFCTIEEEKARVNLTFSLTDFFQYYFHGLFYISAPLSSSVFN